VNHRRVFLLAAVGAVAGGVGFGLATRRGPAIPEVPAPTPGRATLPSSPAETPTLVDLDGNTRALDAWGGKVVLVNFWATWCAPCREEIPALIALREQLRDRDFEVVGIAIDGADKVRGYARDMRISYPILIADFSAIDWMRRLGNKPGALPFSLVLDRNGSPAAQHLGLLTVESARRLVAPTLGL